MISRKCAAIITFGVVLVFIALISGDKYLLTIGSTPLIFVATSYLMFATPKVSVKRRVSSNGVFEGDNIRIELTIRNMSSGFMIIEIYDEIPRNIALHDGRNHAFFALKKDEIGHLEYVINCPLRGEYLLGPVTVRAYDFFTLFYENYSMDIATEVKVYPHIEDIGNISLKTLYKKMPIGTATLRMPGSGKEFHQIREYQPTDPLKNINWKVYAKLRELMVNEYEKEDIYDVYVTLDAREISAMGTINDCPLEHEIRAMLGVIEILIKDGNRVTLGIHGKGIRIVKAGFGAARYRVFLEVSAEIMPGGNTGIKSIFNAISTRMTPKSPVIMIHTLLNDRGVEDVCRYLLSMGHSVTVISPIPTEITGLETDKKYIKDEIFRQHRRMLIKTLRHMGVMVINWDPKKPLKEMLIKKLVTEVGKFAT